MGLRRTNATHLESSAIVRAASPAEYRIVEPGNRPKQIQMRHDLVDKVGYLLKQE